ncbi:MAG TPA: hypothetical protein VF820_05525 [Patescibacteria group bacterium]
MNYIEKHFSERKILEAIIRNKKKIYLILLLLLLVLILYSISLLPYFNLFIPQILLVHGFFIGAILIMNPKPQMLIKLVIILFALLIIPVSLGMRAMPEQVGNFIYALLIIAIILYIKQLRIER